MSWSKRQIWKARLAALGPILKDLALLDEWQRLSVSELQQLQQERLANLLLHAHRSTNYYRRVLKAHGVISSGGGVRLDRFDTLPLLSKPLLRDELDNMKSADLDRRHWYVNRSGGSTGETAHFIQDRDFDCWLAAVKLQFDGWTGFRLCDRKVVLWGSTSDADGSGSPLRTRVGRWLSNELWLPASRLTEDDILAHAQAIEDFRPVQLLAYVDRIYEFSRVAERRALSIYSPRSVMTSAGTLYPAMRETIERVFGAPVFDRYGSRDVGDIACECDRHNGLHVSAPCHHVEILRPNGSPAAPGEEGEIVITNLVNYAMPLIRYRIGDTGIWSAEPCPCGRTWPLLARVTGRTVDAFLTRDGALMGGEYFFGCLEGYEWLERFQLVQQSVDEVDVFLQLFADSGELDAHRRDQIVSVIRRAMGEKCVVNVQVVPDIQSMPSGKYLCMVSKVRSQEEARR